MSLQILAGEYAGYNLWANVQMVEWLRKKPGEVLELEVPSSFPTIKATLFHIWNSEDAWMERLRRGKRRFDYHHVFEGSPQELFDGVLEQSGKLLDYIQKLPEAGFLEKIEFSMPDVGDYNLSIFEMIHQCLNHSTYHRGQIVTMGRNLKLTDPPMTDYLLYAGRKR
jgi:uncharacterized damage-inducible protein DinB